MKKERTTMQAGMTLALLLFTLTMSAWPASSAITIQGKLTNSASKPLTGTRVWRVQFYDAPSGGSALGTALTGSTAVSATGRFAIEAVPPAQAVKASGELYYELAIDSAATPDGTIGSSDVFPGRVKVTSVMWSQRSAQADMATTASAAINAANLDGVPASSYATTGALNTGLAGKANNAHTHQLQNLSGAVTDAQVPDDITINFAKAAGTATTATVAQFALLAEMANNAKVAINAVNAELATTATTALLANNATTASVALKALSANNATTAAVALTSLNASKAASANNATTATYATAAGMALMANSATQADQLDGHHATDFALQAAMTAALAGKSDTSHNHLLQNLGGAVTDAQVPDDITINYAKAAGTATTATLATSALSAPEHDTLALVTGRGATTGNALAFTNTTDTTATGPVNGALAVAGGVGIAKKLSVASDVIIGGNLYTNGGTHLLTWQAISANTQGQSGYGYLANNAAQVLNVTLPASPAIGDVVRVGGQATGGWKVAQNAGQKINLRGLGIHSYKTFMKKGFNASFAGFAMTPDATRMVAAVNGGQLYTSSDAGTTWTARVSGNKTWHQVAVTPDGSKMLAAAEGDYLYVSTNGGQTWTQRDSIRNWNSVAISDDGSKMVAGVGITNMSFGQIYTSSDGGATWTPRGSSLSWSSIACSGDGSTILASAYGNNVYLSTDGGATFTATIGGAFHNWTSVLMTPDASKMMAVDYSGSIYVSYDKGVTWITRNSIPHVTCGAMSADGNTIALGSSVDWSLNLSTNGGTTWETKLAGSSFDCQALALSGDGGWIYGSTQSSQIAAFRTLFLSETTLGATGYLAGGPETALELQYAGNGVFRPLSHCGALGAK